MKVKQIMQREVVTVRPEQHLGQAARLLRDTDCGAVPVVNGRGCVVGVVTDRDVALGALAKDRRLEEIQVQEVMAQEPFTISPDADLSDAQSVMRDRCVRRLPVIDAEGRLKGIISIDDLARDAVLEGDEPFREQVLETLVASSQPFMGSRRRSA